MTGPKHDLSAELRRDLNATIRSGRHATRAEQAKACKAREKVLRRRIAEVEAAAKLTELTEPFVGLGEDLENV